MGIDINNQGLYLNDAIKKILEEMDEFNISEFSIGDIVRSGFVRSYLIQKTKLGLGFE